MTPHRQAAREGPPRQAPIPTIGRKPGEQFNPYGLFNGIFIPEAICKYRGISLGAKLIYGRLCRYAGRDGAVYPSVSTLAAELGIGKTQARSYLQELEREYFIAVDRESRHFGPNGSGGTNRYIFVWHIAFEGEQGKLRKTPPVRKTGGVPIRKSEPLPLRRTGAEENHLQESQEKESQLRKDLGNALANVASGEAQSSHPPKPISVDDDEKLPEPSVCRSAWEEIHGKFQAANRGAGMGFQDECWLKDAMERRGITPEALAKLIDENPLTGFHSRMAGLKWLVKKFRTKTRSSVELDNEARAAFGILYPPEESPRCEPCGNSGRLLERIEGKRPRVTDQYCDCRMGNELKTIEARKATRAVPADAPPVPS